jgi:hypothetical protein
MSGSAVNQKQHSGHHSQESEQEIAIGDSQAEEWQKVAQNHP